MRRDLKAGKAAIRRAHHADVAVAPWLVRQPLDGIVAVQLLLGEVLIPTVPADRSVPRTPRWSTT